MALDFPTKPIQVIVPYSAGGTNDLITRVMDKKLAAILGQPIIVLNKTGGGGAVGMKFAAAAKPDGYTVLSSPPGVVLKPILNPNIGFSLSDFTPICQAVASIWVITVKADSPWKTLNDLIQDARKNPGKFTYATSGPGSGFNFVGELFKVETKTDILHLPMGGEAEAVTGVLGGHASMTYSTMGSVAQHIKAGTLRALAVVYSRRLKQFPEIPCTKELGYPELINTSWNGFFVPAKTDKEIVKKLAKAFDSVLKDEEVISNMEKIEMIVENLILADAVKFFQGEEKKWKEVAKEAKMSIESKK
jgi:tripartite-type tricarboxylate transporter receptor subunit TctC